jgi:hypothetical protein
MLDEKDDIHPLFYGAPKSTEFRKLRKRLVQGVREAIDRYGMIEPGARWLICLSGFCRSIFWPATWIRASQTFRQPFCPNSCRAWGWNTGLNMQIPILS